MQKGALAVMFLLLLAAYTFAEIGEPVAVGRGRDPRWSPDGSRMAIARGDSLVLIDSKTFEESPSFYQGKNLRYYWLTDSSLAVLELRLYLSDTLMLRAVEISEVSISGFRSPVAFDSSDMRLVERRLVDLYRDNKGTVILLDRRSGVRQDIALASPSGTDSGEIEQLTVDTQQRMWGPVWLHHGDNNEGRRATLSANHYRDPILAPTGARFCCWAMRGDLVVFDTLGNELANLGAVENPVWSRDGNWIHYSDVNYSHYDVEGADTWVATFDGKERQRLTFSPNLGDVVGEFSPDSRFLAYADVASQQLYLIRLK